MAEVEANVDSSAAAARAGRSRLRRALNRRTVVRAGAVALAVLGVVALVARPSTRIRAEARVVVPIPLDVGDAVGAILTHADGATATAQGRRVTVASSDASREVARAHAEGLARSGLAAARQHLVAVETRRANAAKSDRALAAAQLASLASHSGLTDPEAAYRALVAVVQDLQRQLAAATAAGRPLTAINAQLAENQQAVFELQVQVTRHAELVQAEAAAAGNERAATSLIDASTRAVSSASVKVSDHATRGGFGTATGVAALVLAGVMLLFSELWSVRTAPRPARTVRAEPRREPEPVKERDDAALALSEAAALEASGRPGSRYLDFYRALAPSGAEAEAEADAEEAADPAPVAVDLVHEEAVEEAPDASRDLEQQAAGEPDGSATQEAAGDAKATRLSR